MSERDEWVEKMRTAFFGVVGGGPGRFYAALAAVEPLIRREVLEGHEAAINRVIASEPSEQRMLGACDALSAIGGRSQARIDYDRSLAAPEPAGCVCNHVHEGPCESPRLKP